MINKTHIYMISNSCFTPEIFICVSYPCKTVIKMSHIVKTKLLLNSMRWWMGVGVGVGGVGWGCRWHLLIFGGETRVLSIQCDALDSFQSRLGWWLTSSCSRCCCKSNSCHPVHEEDTRANQLIKKINRKANNPFKDPLRSSFDLV